MMSCCFFFTEVMFPCRVLHSLIPCTLIVLLHEFITEQGWQYAYSKVQQVNINRAGSLNHFSGEPDWEEPNFSQSKRGIS